MGIGVVPPSHALGDHGQANIESLWHQWVLTQERPKSRPVACIGLSWCCAAQPLSEMSARLRLAGRALRRLLALRGVNVLQSCLEPFVLPWFPYRVVRVPPSEMLTIRQKGGEHGFSLFNSQVDGSTLKSMGCKCGQTKGVRPFDLTPCHLVGAAGFELATLCSQSRCATRLRYAPKAVNVA